MMRPDKLLQDWAFAFLIGGIVVPATATILTKVTHHKQELKKARIEGCRLAIQRGMSEVSPEVCNAI